MKSMYKVDIDNKKLCNLKPVKFSDLHLKERYDIQEWIESNPEILGEELLIIGKELFLPSGIRLDLLAIDKSANLVIIELKRDNSGKDAEWQVIKYASYCSNFLIEDIFQYYAQYLKSNEDAAQSKIEDFIDEELDKLNDKQRLILVSKEFHSDVASAVLWLRDYEIDIECIRLVPYLDQNKVLFINPEIIIPLPEAKDYIIRKESKQKEMKRSARSSFSLEKSDLPINELEQKLLVTLNRESDLIPRIIAFLEIINSEDRPFDREEIKKKLFEKGIGKNIGHTGRYLSNISQFLTKKQNSHLRQMIEFETGGSTGETKNNYYVLKEYRVLLSKVLEKFREEYLIE